MITLKEVGSSAPVLYIVWEILNWILGGLYGNEFGGYGSRILRVLIFRCPGLPVIITFKLERGLGQPPQSITVCFKSDKAT